MNNFPLKFPNEAIFEIKFHLNHHLTTSISSTGLLTVTKTPLEFDSRRCCLRFDHQGHHSGRRRMGVLALQQELAVGQDQGHEADRFK